jgi:enterochelin esterase-like enzyme
MMMRFISLFLFMLSCFFATAQNPLVSSGHIERLNNFSSKYVDARNVDIWFPEGYNVNERYPVLYMHDGQMLFDSSNTWNHQEWKVDETVSSLIENGTIKPCIVVGIWNNGVKRNFEYFPEKALNYLPDAQRDTLMKNMKYPMQADLYLQFLVYELKPYVDRWYSTLSSPENTFVGGSSRGGLISMYAMCEYPQFFGGAICISTHWIGGINAPNELISELILRYLKEHLPTKKTHKFYFDHGTKNLDSKYGELQIKANKILKKGGYRRKNLLSLVFEGKDHAEPDWSERFNIPLTFMLKK